jgi:carboxypeptidase Taq
VVVRKIYFKFLPDAIEKIIEHQITQPPIIKLDGRFSVDKQKQLGLKIMKTLGFDFDRGRLDASTHPFCGGSSQDIRITTRYREDEFLSSLMGIVHETGHALYELGQPRKWLHQPVGGWRSMSYHESQSLFYEKQIANSRAFFEYMAPFIQEAFGESGQAWQADNIYRTQTQVQRSLIRVDADEVTYPLHVILRYRLEKELIEGDLKIKDLPEAWNNGMESLVGIRPKDNKDGCMQDVHWPGGAFGYFQSYTLGALIAAQLKDTMRQSYPDFEADIRRGDFADILAWLRTNIHENGSRYSQNELIKHATGKALSTDAYKAHIKERYLDS